MTAVAHTESPLAPGYELDRYELLCPIAEGGMASVWVARQRGKHGFEKLVALKTILPKFAADVRFQEMFLDEARIASRIEHLNVAQIFDLGEEHDVLYLAMEYVDGDALSKLNRACQKKGVSIPTGVVLRVLADACAGLHDAHELKDSAGHPLEIVHRDVSPHNILVSTKGVAKLIDFGIAKARSRVGGDTNSGVLKGKIQYMAPEQALGLPVDRRADIWAVGAILYHVIAGKPPYEGDNQLATLHLLGSGRPPVPLPSAVHPSIAAVVRKALAHAAENRYATAHDLRDAIEDAMIEAMVPTTCADVAAFAALHLGERAERRRQAIESALAAAAEHGPRDSPRESTPPGTKSTRPAEAPKPAASSSAALPSIHDMTVPEVPTAKAPAPIDAVDAAGPLPARISEPPPLNASSYATLGSAAIASSTAPQTGSRKWLVTFVGLAVLATTAVTVISLRMAHSGSTLPPSSAADTGASLPSSAPTGLLTPASTGGPAAPGSVSESGKATAGPGIPTVAASSLPKVTTPQAPDTPPDRWSPPPTHHSTPQPHHGAQTTSPSSPPTPSTSPSEPTTATAPAAASSAVRKGATATSPAGPAPQRPRPSRGSSPKAPPVDDGF